MADKTPRFKQYQLTPEEVVLLKELTVCDICEYDSKQTKLAWNLIASYHWFVPGTQKKHEELDYPWIIAEVDQSKLVEDSEEMNFDEDDLDFTDKDKSWVDEIDGNMLDEEDII